MKKIIAAIALTIPTLLPLRSEAYCNYFQIDNQTQDLTFQVDDASGNVFDNVTVTPHNYLKMTYTDLEAHCTNHESLCYFGVEVLNSSAPPTYIYAGSFSIDVLSMVLIGVYPISSQDFSLRQNGNCDVTLLQTATTGNR